MYKKKGAQLSMYDFVPPFEGALDQNNRWIRVSSELDWKTMEEEYSHLFAARGGNLALPVRMAFGSLVIREALNLTDAETVRLITESPYLQYFIGLHSFTTEPPFAVRSMKTFRKRFPAEQVTAAALRVKELSKKKL